MADKADEGKSVPNEDLEPAQVKPTADRSKDELEAQVVNKADLDKGVLDEPEHEQDQTSVPTPYAPAERPPWATQRHDVPIVASSVLGANAHEPPDPDVFDAEGRIRDESSDS